MKRTFSLFIVLLILVSAAAPTLAQQEEAVTVIPAGETVKIGIVTDLSNIIPAPGQDIANGALLAIKQFNESGTWDWEVEPVVEDDRCVGEDSTSVANLLVSDPNLVAVVGPICSGATIPASEIYEDARIVMVSPSATAVAVTNRGLSVVNRTAFSDGVQGVVAARFISQVLGAEKLAVLHDASAYGEGLAVVVRDTFENEIGGTVTAFEAIDPEEQDYRAQLTVLASDPPDVLYFGGYTNQAALIVEQMKEVGLEDTIFFSADGVYNQDFLDLAGENAEGVYVSVGATVEGDPEIRAAYDAAYKEEYDLEVGELGPFSPQAYDAANIILNALVEVAEVDDDGNLVIDREALIAAVRATKGWEGASGTITCDDKGDCGSVIIDFFLAQDGEWVEQEAPAEIQVSNE